MARLGDGYRPEPGPWDHLANNGGTDRRGGPADGWHRLSGEGERPELPEAFRVAFEEPVAPLPATIEETPRIVAIATPPTPRPQPKPTPSGLRAWVRRAIEGLEERTGENE